MMSPDLPFWDVLWPTHILSFYTCFYSCLFLSPFMQYCWPMVLRCTDANAVIHQTGEREPIHEQLSRANNQSYNQVPGWLLRSLHEAPSYCFMSCKSPSSNSGPETMPARTCITQRSGLLDAGHIQSWSGMNLRLIKQCRWIGWDPEGCIDYRSVGLRTAYRLCSSAKCLRKHK